MARQAMKQGALQKFDPQTQHLSSNAIDHAIRKLEQALKDGRMDDARQAMAQLNRMMDQLKNAHIMSQEEAHQQQQAQQKGRQQMGAVQDMVQRETTLLDHAQQRAPRSQLQVPPIMQDPGQMGLFPPQGTEDPGQTPDQSQQGLAQQMPSGTPDGQAPRRRNPARPRKRDPSNRDHRVPRHRARKARPRTPARSAHCTGRWTR